MQKIACLWLENSIMLASVYSEADYFYDIYCSSIQVATKALRHKGRTHKENYLILVP